MFVAILRSTCWILHPPPKPPCTDWTFCKVIYYPHPILPASPPITSRRPPALPHWTQLQVWTMNSGQVTQAKASKAEGWPRDSLRSTVSPWISPSPATSEEKHGQELGQEVSHNLAVCEHTALAPSQMRQHVCWFTCTWGFLAGHLERAFFF